MGMHKNGEDFEGLLQEGKFDELEIPPDFSGTFYDLFQYLLSSYGTITIGLYRFDSTLIVRIWIKCSFLGELLSYLVMWHFSHHRVPLFSRKTMHLSS
jgi:hypothetical protein